MRVNHSWHRELNFSLFLLSSSQLLFSFFQIQITDIFRSEFLKKQRTLIFCYCDCHRIKSNMEFWLTGKVKNNYHCFQGIKMFHATYCWQFLRLFLNHKNGFQWTCWSNRTSITLWFMNRPLIFFCVHNLEYTGNCQISKHEANMNIMLILYIPITNLDLDHAVS